MRAAEFLKAFKFSVEIGGRSVGVARISDVEVMFGPHGRTYTKPVTIEAAPKAGTEGLAGALSAQPKSRPTVKLVELTREGQAGRVIVLDRCKVSRVRTAPHDAMEDRVVLDSVTLHPRRVRYHRTSLAVIPRPVNKVEPWPEGGES